MSSDDNQAQEKVPEPTCDHICLLPARHINEGRPHFYGYRFPLDDSFVRLREAVTALADQLDKQADASNAQSEVTATPEWSAAFSANAAGLRDAARRLRSLLEKPQ